MKKLLCIFLAAVLLTGCTASPGNTNPNRNNNATESLPPEAADRLGEVKITLSDENIGTDYSTDGASGTINSTEDTGIYTARDIVYYPEGKDFTFGEGTAADAHPAGEAEDHVVVHITKPGTYRITGKLSAGQIAVDLGEDAKNDPSAVVNLILDNADITCTVAPAIIFYNVYECGSVNPAAASATVDTSAAGANVFLADGSINNITGSYVAEIYREGTVIFDDDGEVEDAKKLHKYDAAFYSKCSMNISGNDGILNINAENEGLDSELHLTINGGEINIVSGNDGINTNEDGVSVTTINGGKLNIVVNGATGEGDGIDSNGWLVINGGTVTAFACATSGDAGIDADMGIHINGGTVCATGNMLDRIADGGQTYAVFTFDQRRNPGRYALKNADGTEIVSCTPANAFQYLILSCPELYEGSYTLWCDDVPFRGALGSGKFSGGLDRPGFPGGDDRPDVEIPPQPTQPIVTQGTPGQPPAPPEGETMPQDMTPPEMPQGGQPPAGTEDGFFPGGQGNSADSSQLTDQFSIVKGGNFFIGVRPVETAPSAGI